MSDSFIHELALEVFEEEGATLDTRFIVAGFLYNGCLHECLNRLLLVQESKEYQKARKLPRKHSERNKLFKEAIKKRGFDEYSIHKWLTTYLKKFPFRDHLDSTVCQTIATRVFRAVKEYSVGKRGKPRFKKLRRMRSMEGKSNITSIRFKEGVIVWNGLVLKPIYDLKDSYGVEAHALSCRVKYVRLVRRIVKGRVRYFSQLIVEGTPLCKRLSPSVVVGVDLGPSTVAVVSENGALLDKITPLKDKSSKILQRKIARSREIHQKATQRVKKLYTKLAETKRKQAATRARLLGKKVNKIVAFGKIIKIEKLSYKALQKCYGRSVGRHAPGMFVEKLRHKAENAGGKFIEISTYKTKLSQTCQCGTQEKKPLSQRQHKCSCGVEMQRDLYSAFLTTYVENDSLDISQASQAWPGVQPLLWQALSRYNETAKS